MLTYEEIVSNKRGAITQIAKFISDELVDKLQNDGELMEKILFHSSVKSMKKDPLRWCSARSEEKFTPFIRNGRQGAWKELLSDAQVDKLDKKTREIFTEDELRELGDKYW